MEFFKDDAETETLPLENVEEDGEIEIEEEALLSEVFQSLMDDVDLEGFDLNQIINYSHENGFLMLSCELKSGEIIPVPFD